MSGELIGFHKRNDHIAVLILNRPGAANAFSMELLRQFNDRLTQLESDPLLRCLVITGAGHKVFCAGADLKERSKMTEQQTREAVQYIGSTLQRVSELPMPTIAAINGAAFGGGLELALACDLRISASHSKLALTETSLGIIPGAGGTQRLSRQVGLSKAKEMIFTASPVDAEKAEQIGLVEYVHDSEELMEKAESLAEEIAKNAPVALRQAKLAISKGIDMELSEGLAFEKQCYQQTINTKDRLEGLQAFKEKRTAVFIGE
ncbi:enoyl-CoA hydratase-related protein [Sediminibacillus halophilus]|uniref:Enoyl-CoA hydratase/carnithine racemase n=1 Tax=Sediminibacillus halophilus TaxID=482461 RepID=A0A1G9M808_9BACI|nr:enoyl-CoA hydratase-related protein [Sediminibacillus halophilus]SDL70379.1 Enoyl-CoA hydratase/carnithine racemase [Sediminibacillus halophilus]